MNFTDIDRVRLCGLILAVAVATSTFVVCLREFGALQISELRLHDRTKAELALRQPVPDVALVAVDDHDLGIWGWPLPDDTLAAIILGVSGAGAKAIGVDIYRDRPVGQGRADLVAAFEATKAIGIFSLGMDGRPGIAPPFPTRASERHGFSDMLIDDDGVARRALLIVTDEAGTQMSFALRLALTATGQTGLSAWQEDPQVLAFGKTPIPRLTDGFGPYRGLDDAGYQVPIGYTHALPIAKMISASDLLAGRVEPEALTGKVVIIGTTSDTVKDQFRTPLSGTGAGSFAFGIQVHAAILQQLIDASNGNAAALRSPASTAQSGMIFAASLAGGGLVTVLRTALAIIVGGPGLALLCALITTTALAQSLWLPALPMALAWGGSSLGCFAALSLLERARYRAVVRLFSDHMSPALAGEVWRNRHMILSGGKPAPLRLYATVLFADLSGSTAVGGATEPQAYMAWVSDYLDMVAAIATAQGGFVEKFTGDGIMVVFGAPLPSVDEPAQRRDAKAACRCAVAICDATRLRNKTGGILAPYLVRIGLHSGPVFGGTIGNRGAMRYNVKGDTVNIAARVEAFGKKCPDRRQEGQMVCLTDATADLGGADFRLDSIGPLLHDDGQRTFEVYQLLGTKANS